MNACHQANVDPDFRGAHACSSTNGKFTQFKDPSEALVASGAMFTESLTYESRLLIQWDI